VYGVFYNGIFSEGLTIQIRETCWLVFFLVHMLYDQRGLKTRSSTAKQIYQSPRLTVPSVLTLCAQKGSLL
jgi:hypothetical protein